jgi:hypothetical protein
MQLDVAALENRADLDGEGLAAGIALVNANARALAFQRAALIDGAAMGADATIRPYASLYPAVGRRLVSEVFFVKYGYG